MNVYVARYGSNLFIVATLENPSTLAALTASTIEATAYKANAAGVLEALPTITAVPLALWIRVWAATGLWCLLLQVLR